MKIYLKTYLKTDIHSGPYFLPEPQGENDFIDTEALERGKESLIYQVIYLDSEMNALRYLINISRNWYEIIEGLLLRESLEGDIKALANLYEQILQVSKLLLDQQVINLIDVDYFAYSINHELLRLIASKPGQLLKEYPKIFSSISPNNPCDFNYALISYIDNPILFTAITF